MNFYQLWETIQHREENNSSLLEVLRRLSGDDCVKFALYCAEDALDKNNEQTLPLAQNCINLVKQYLNNRSVDVTSLREAFNQAFSLGASIFAQESVAARAIYSAGYVAQTTFNLLQGNDFLDQTYYAAVDASVSSGLFNGNKYLNLAKSFLSKTTSKNPLHKTFFQDPDISSIAAFLDHAEDVDENIVLHDKDEFVFNMPGHLIRAKNKVELAKKILNDKWAMNYLRKLYKV